MCPHHPVNFSKTSAGEMTFVTPAFLVMPPTHQVSCDFLLNGFEVSPLTHVLLLTNSNKFIASVTDENHKLTIHGSVGGGEHKIGMNP
jgi:hypothetical protein